MTDSTERPDWAKRTGAIVQGLLLGALCLLALLVALLQTSGAVTFRYQGF